MSSAMNMLSSFTFFVLFVSLVIPKSLNLSDENLINSSNLKNNLTPVILNDEYNHFIEKRQNNYNNGGGMQLNGNITNSNATFNQMKKDIQNGQNILNYILYLLKMNLDTNFFDS